MEATNNSTPSTKDAELDALWAQFEACEPVMTVEQVDEASMVMFGADAVRTVRAGLFMLTRSGRELMQTMHSDSEMVSVYSELAECVSDRAKRLRDAAEALDTAGTRLRLALCDAADTTANRHESGAA